VHEEYEIAAALGLKVVEQSLIDGKTPYDMLKAVDGDGNTRELWFDISSFYPEI
jgi:predicted RNA-binding protein associated with RNAse of E/G family